MDCCMGSKERGSRWRPFWKSRKKRAQPSVSAPLQLLLKHDADGDHIFLKKHLKKPKTCQKCHKPIVSLGSKCRVCKFLCHKTCESDEANPTRAAEEERRAGDGEDEKTSTDDAPPRRRRRPLGKEGDEEEDAPEAIDGNANRTKAPTTPISRKSPPLLANGNNSTSVPRVTKASGSSAQPVNPKCEPSSSKTPPSSSAHPQESYRKVDPEELPTTPPSSPVLDGNASRSVSPELHLTLSGHSRFSDTSLQIHRLWLRSRRKKQPAAVHDTTDAIESSPGGSPAANRVGPLPVEGRGMPTRGWQSSDSQQLESSTSIPEEKPKGDSASVDHYVHRETAKQNSEEKYAAMELTYVTERIIALWFPVAQCEQSNGIRKSVDETQEKMIAEAANMLRIKHANNCMIFDLSVPSEADLHSGSLGVVSQALGWHGSSLAPPLERLCSACKHIESWLSSNPQHVAVLYSSEPSGEERIGVVISAYLTYSSICGSEEQALDRFAMRRFFQDKLGGLKRPSNIRYVSYFSGLLSGDIRMNAEPLFLTHIVIQGAPKINAVNRDGSKSALSGVYRNDRDHSIISHTSDKSQQPNICFFLKIYQQGLSLVYTSPVYKLNTSSNQLTIALESTYQTYFPTSSFPLHLRGDVLIKGYYLCQQCSSGTLCNTSRNSSSPLHRHVLFQCQFHTCAVANHCIRYSRKELDEVDSHRAYAKYPPDGGMFELHFSGSSEPWPSPTPSIPLVFPRVSSPFSPSIYAQPSLSSSAYSFPSVDEEEEQFAIGGVVAWDSMEALCSRRRRRGDGSAEDSTVVDESVLSSIESEGHHLARAEEEEERVAHLSGPLDGSLYATVSKSPPPTTTSSQALETTPRRKTSGGRLQGASEEVEGRRNMDLGGTRPAHHREISPPATHAYHDASRQEVLTSSPADEHARLDELLGDMLMTVENIPDLADAAPSPTFSGPRAAEEAAGGRRGEAALPAEGAGGGAAGGRRRGDGEGGGEEDIPYHARQDSRPFTYGAVPEGVAERRRLAAEERSEEDEEDMRTKQQHQPPGLESPGLVRKVSSAGQRSAGGGRLLLDGGRSPVRSEDSRIDWRRDELGSPSSESYTGLTWLQRQQQKLRDRREGRLRQERIPQEYQLLSELRTYQRSSSVSGTQTLPSSSGRWHGREDGYASDTSLLVGLGSRYAGDHNGSGDDEWDEGRGKGDGGEGEWMPEGRRGGGRVPVGNYSLPLRINTADEEKVMTLHSEPGSPLLPRRSVSRETTSRYATSSRHITSKQREENTLRTIGSGVQGGGREWQVDGERPFMAVKRAHEQRSKGSLGSLDDGMTAPISQSRDDSLSSWATASMTWGEDDDDVDGDGLDSVDGRRSRVRPQTPAFPVQPRTPYSNGSATPVSTTDHQQRHVLVEVNVQGNNAGLPPKSPTTTRKERSQTLPDAQHHGGHQRSPSMSNGGSYIQTLPHPSTPTSGGQKQQYSDHQEVSPAHVKFVRDTSRFWYKPTISREEAIAILKDKQPGTFVVRDSNSFPGAFGLALKVATPPSNVSNRILSNTNANGDISSELVRHFLIEPTSRGVKLKGCANEPVFSSLSALVYQHSLTPMALPCQLLLPESEPSPGKLAVHADGSVASNQVLLQQGAACNVLYLGSVDTESLTGPQAVRRAVTDIFSRNPVPAPTVVHFKVSAQGITLTDNKRKLFFRRHYPVNSISYCGLDPDDHRWTEKNPEIGVSIQSNRCFGYVARKPSTKGDNQCHIFAELDPEQPATAIVNFVTRVMMAGNVGKSSNIV